MKYSRMRPPLVMEDSLVYAVHADNGNYLGMVMKNRHGNWFATGFTESPDRNNRHRAAMDLLKERRKRLNDC